MTKMTILIKDEKALPLLREMEEQDLIKLDNDKLFYHNKPSNLSSRFSGKLSAKTATILQQQVMKSREDWERNF